MTMYDMKGVARSDEHVMNYHPAVSSSWTELFRVFLAYCSDFWPATMLISI